MKGRSMRVKRIEISDFKNVKRGILNLEKNKKPNKASILGLYGQNGSGKTAVVDALALLKMALQGKQIPSWYTDYINIDANYSVLSFQFEMKHLDYTCNIWYQFELAKAVDEISTESDDISEKFKTIIRNEVLSFSYVSNEEKIRKSSLIDTRTEDVFVPRTKFEECLGGSNQDVTDLLVMKKYVQLTSRSFIFSKEMVNQFRKFCGNEVYKTIINSLKRFGERELFIINTETSGLISLNALPLAFKYPEEGKETFGNLMIPLDESSYIPEDAENVACKVIENMNIVLQQIVPGLTIEIKELSEVVLKDGKIGKNIQLMSLKNGKAISFKYESDGIKKIVSVLQLLIAVYNHPSVTVAIDELDAGIFEYLLGEILHIIAEKGKGQLIFTSHNLRPLETIDKGFIAFTTTNPSNRYIRMSNVKGNNNLRDFYYRDIVLGEQSEPVYSPTNNSEIALAFREAGEAFGS